jgi:hypothetical protein
MQESLSQQQLAYKFGFWKVPGLILTTAINIENKNICEYNDNQSPEDESVANS